MAILTHKVLERPQRVRQFALRQKLGLVIPDFPRVAEPFHQPPDLDATDDIFGDVFEDVFEEGASEPSDAQSEEKTKPFRDLPLFLKYSSLRRRLDDAFENCYRNSVVDRMRHFFQSFLGS